MIHQFTSHHLWIVYHYSSSPFPWCLKCFGLWSYWCCLSTNQMTSTCLWMLVALCYLLSWLCVIFFWVFHFVCLFFLLQYPSSCFFLLLQYPSLCSLCLFRWFSVLLQYPSLCSLCSLCLLRYVSYSTFILGGSLWGLICKTRGLFLCHVTLLPFEFTLY